MCACAIKCQIRTCGQDKNRKYRFINEVWRAEVAVATDACECSFRIWPQEVRVRSACNFLLPVRAVVQQQQLNP